MTAIEIQNELKENKVTQAKIAYGLKPPVTPMTVSKVINKVIVSDRIMRAVASAIKKIMI
jgi:hypothetical protein